ncbi:MAG: hypothetical protein AAFU69_00060 [Pseudomonadota bacterium]
MRSDGWPFAIQDLQLPQHTALIAQSSLEDALLEDVYDEDTIRRLSHQINRIDPLSPLPFEALLTLELEKDTVDPMQARQFADATLARDARNLTARMFLFDQAIIDQEWDIAFDAFGKAFELWPSEAAEIRSLLYETLTDETWSAALIARLNRGDAWVLSFIQNMPLDLVDPALVAEFHRPFEDQHDLLIARLIRAFGLEAAHKAWATLRPDEAASHRFGLIDLTFSGSDALRPFNWVINPGFAEMNASRPGLQVFFRGRERPEIASQIIFLAPGNYRFFVHKTAPSTDPAGDIIWRIACVPTGETLLEVSVFAPVFEAHNSGVPFERPPGCEYQELTLTGQPGVFTRRFSLTINAVDISETAQP